MNSASGLSLLRDSSTGRTPLPLYRMSSVRGKRPRPDGPVAGPRVCPENRPSQPYSAGSFCVAIAGPLLPEADRLWSSIWLVIWPKWKWSLKQT